MNKEQLQRRIATVEKTTVELSEERGMLKSELEASPEYQNILDQISNLKKQKDQLLLSNKIIQDLTRKINESSQELKELKEILSSELFTYFRETNKTNIEDENGKICQIIINAKLKKTNQRNLF